MRILPLGLVCLLVPGCPDDGDPGAALDVIVTVDAGSSQDIQGIAAEDPGPIAPKDIPPPPLDEGPDVEVDWGELGTPCDDNEDCKSGLCIPTNEGKVCTILCIEECPPGFGCDLLQMPGSDPIYLCLPTHLGLCKPCQSSADCEVGFCVDGGPPGDFCGSPCAAGCPDGYGCQDVNSVEGDPVEQCVVAQGECECSVLAVIQAAQTGCEASNELGTCTGVRNCTAEGGLSACDAPAPAEEVCNGADDDCDASTDEGIADLSCGVGPCDHSQAGCVDGVPQTCDALEGAKPEACNGVDDDCDGDIDNGFDDLDMDGIADCIDEDLDEDGVPNVDDNCISDANPLQEDYDLDTIGDACDPDDDNDLVTDDEDCAPLNPAIYPGATELCNGVDDDCQGGADDGLDDVLVCGVGACLTKAKACDGGGPGVCTPPDGADEDACDGTDDDCNGLVDDGHPDTDEDGLADCVDTDDDGDGVPDDEDNCPLTQNPAQDDLEGDEIGDVCDDDDDNDKALDTVDNCPEVSNADQLDTDKDQSGDECDDDDDGDGVADDGDNCVLVKNADQLDTDKDQAGDACDDDDDGDTVLDGSDNCVLVKNTDQLDTDEDESGDACDDDDDNDNVLDAGDNCVLVSNAGQLDTDQDKLGNACDDDDDGDDSLDGDDCAPLDGAVHPKAVEVCDGKDNNCNKATDESDPSLGSNCDPAGLCMLGAMSCSEGKLTCTATGPALADTDPWNECGAQTCTGAGACHAADGVACNDAAQCESGYCVDGVCCQGPCSGVCEQCGAGGVCGAASDDAACGTIDCDGKDSSCTNYHDLTSGRCQAKGQCKAPNSGACNQFTTSPAVNGGWGGWSCGGWSGCSETCGGGTKTRSCSRSCNNPSPSCGGAACSGGSTKTESGSCNTQTCCPTWRARWVGASGWTGWVTSCNPGCGHGSNCNCNGSNFCSFYQNGQSTTYWLNGCGAAPITITCQVELQ